MGEDASIEEFVTGAEDNGIEAEADSDGNDGKTTEGTGTPAEGAGTGTDGSTGETDEHGGDAGTDVSPDGVDAEAIEPTASTYGWTPGAAICEACGTEIEGRWRDGDGMVCRDCKEW